MKRFFIVFVFKFIALYANAQFYSISGKITDDNNEVLPFSSVLVKGTTIGTTSNADGFYSLKLKPGKYELVYQYIGYKKTIQTINIVDKSISLNVSLIPESYELKEIVITETEDPAYAIIKKAIKKRKIYFNEVNSFSCKVYIKGLQRLNNFPKKMIKLLNAMNKGGQKIDSTLLGVVYLSESETKYYFRKPGDEKEIMYSSRISGNNNTFSFNKASDMKFNVYQNLISLGGLSDRPLISPINDNAFLFYRYKLKGTSLVDGKELYKIEVIPKRKTDPCFRGFIYIQDDTWRVHSSDVYLTKDAKINFVDTLFVKQLNSPVNDSLWMPTSFTMTFNFKVLGFIGDGYFTSVYSDYDMTPVFSKDFFKNEMLKVEDESNKKSTEYWNNNRPMPLTVEEKLDYTKKDSISTIKNSRRYLDSVDKIRNKFSLSNIIMGYNYNNSSKKITINTSGILTSGLQYNTVEGANVSIQMNASKRYDNNKSHNLVATTRYGFSNYFLGATMSWKYVYHPMKSEFIHFKLGTNSFQFNGSNPVTPSINSLYTLLNNDNFMKLYKKTYASVNYQKELFNGLIASFNTEYAERSALKNSTNYLWIDNKYKLFTSNNPLNSITDEGNFKINNSLIVELGATIRFKQKYYTRPNEKIVVGSKYPIIYILYTKAIPFLNTKANYDLLKLNIDDYVNIGLLGTLAYKFKTGYFFSNNYIEFMDYKHFDGNQTLLANNNYLNSFKILPYYTFSTNNWYTEAHIEHHFNGFIFNKIPILKKSTLQEVVGFHTLYNDKINGYYELNFGIENIFKIIRLDYVLGYGLNSDFNQGFVIGLGLDF